MEDPGGCKRPCSVWKRGGQECGAGCASIGGTCLPGTHMCRDCIWEWSNSIQRCKKNRKGKLLTKTETLFLKKRLIGYMSGDISALALREAMKPFTRIYTFSSDNVIVKMGEHVRANYLEAIWGKKQHNYGPPHPHVFVACLEELMESFNINRSARRILWAYCRWANSDKATAEKLSQHIKKFTINTSLQGGSTRVEMQLSNCRPPTIANGAKEVQIARFNRIMASSLEEAGGVVQGERGRCAVI